MHLPQAGFVNLLWISAACDCLVVLPAPSSRRGDGNGAVALAAGGEVAFAL